MAGELSILAHIQKLTAHTFESSRKASTPKLIEQYEMEYEDQSMDKLLDHASTGEPKLLQLPGELRNRIYRDALLEPVHIEVNKTYTLSQPGLLSVNKQIRTETQKTYYRENTFLFHLLDYDASSFIKWMGSSNQRACSNWELHYKGDDNWENLRTWLKATFDGEMNGRYTTEDLDDRPNLVVSTFAMVMEMKEDGMAWNDIDRYLNHIHQMLKCADSTWAWVKHKR